MSTHVLILYSDMEYRVGKNIIISRNNHLISMSTLNRANYFPFENEFPCADLHLSATPHEIHVP